MVIVGVCVVMVVGSLLWCWDHPLTHHLDRVARAVRIGLWLALLGGVLMVIS